jgi:hypothetical protein
MRCQRHAQHVVGRTESYTAGALIVPAGTDPVPFAGGGETAARRVRVKEEITGSTKSQRCDDACFSVVDGLFCAR